jgi:hypothetical protein
MLAYPKGGPVTMTRRAIGVGLAVVLLAVPTAADEIIMTFSCVGIGDMMVSPVIYSGDITWGDLAPGTWSIQIDDSLWPDPGDPTARFDYIWDTFYAPAYDPGIPGWIGVFDVPTLPTKPTLTLDETGVGGMTGVARMRFQIVDGNGNETLDEGEGCSGSMGGLVIIIEDGWGAYAGYCGDGAYSGMYSKPECPLWWDSVEFMMSIGVQDCTVATDETSWGTVKALFK